MEGECYLFDCGTPEDFTCVFDHHARFMSGALEVNRHQFDKISRGHQGKKRFYFVPTLCVYFRRVYIGSRHL